MARCGIAQLSRLVVFGLTSLIATLPAAAGPFVPSVVAGFGPAVAAGEGSESLKSGQSFLLNALARRQHGNCWILQASYERYDREGVANLPTAFLNGGRLYRLTGGIAEGEDALTLAAFEVGLRRGRTTGLVRPYVEGLAGASWTEQRGSESVLLNDRRPDLSPVHSTRSTELGPSFSLGAGVEVRAPARLGLVAAAGTRWTPARDLSGPVVPMRFGATWPVEPEPASVARVPSPRAPRLRLSVGTSGLLNPARLRAETDPGLSLALGIELPVTEGLAFSFEGEHLLQKHDVARVLRQESDEFGNLVNVYSGSRPLSLTATALTAGLRVSTSAGRAEGFVRGGLGWGRTGGFGNTIKEPTGATIQDGQMVPVYTSVDIGAGTPASGFAYSATTGFEMRLTGPLRWGAEAGVLGLHLTREDILLLPVRMGFALR